MDINKIRGKSVTNHKYRTSNLWKQTGKTQIRIVPNKSNTDIPFIELFFHYDLKNLIYHLSLSVEQTLLRNLKTNSSQVVIVRIGDSVKS